MATIALYANKINQMPALIKEVKKSVYDYKSELFALKNKSLSTDKSICNLDDVISSIQSSSQTQDQKIASLDTLAKNVEQFAEDAKLIDRNVADIIKKRKDEFFAKHYHLKPDCEKNGWEKICDAVVSVGQWCKEHWKLIVTVVIVIAAIAVIVCFPAAAPFLLLAAKGAIIGSIAGGLMGGFSSLASGGSFFEGFEDGAFTGAITGAIFGGLGGAGQMLGSSCKALGALGNVAKIVPHIANISGGISVTMAGFDLLSWTAGLFAPNNLLTALNQQLHSNKLYNAFQIAVSALAVFSGGFANGMQNPTCFVAGTLILTAAGLVAIEKIKTGDKVVSTNPETGETAEKSVLETFALQGSKLVHVWIDGKEILVTPEHPFWVDEKGWVNASELTVGDELLSANGDFASIAKVELELLDEPVDVYNFKVEDFHTYYVGDCRVLVHNADCLISKSKHPEAAKHIEDAIDEGHPSELTIDRAGAKSNRQASLKGIEKVPGKQLDEFPPAMFSEGGKGASVRPINPHDNMGAGSSMGHQLRSLPDGTKINFVITD